MSNNIQCPVRPTGWWLFSTSGGRRNTNLHPRQHRLYVWKSCRRGSWCWSTCRNPFYGDKRRCCATREERGAAWQRLNLHVWSRYPPSPLATVRRAFVLRAPAPSPTVWPGEFVEVQLPDVKANMQNYIYIFTYSIVSWKHDYQPTFAIGCSLILNKGGYVTHDKYISVLGNSAHAWGKRRLLLRFEILHVDQIVSVYLFWSLLFWYSIQI